MYHEDKNEKVGSCGRENFWFDLEKFLSHHTSVFQIFSQQLSQQFCQINRNIFVNRENCTFLSEPSFFYECNIPKPNFAGPFVRRFAIQLTKLPQCCFHRIAPIAPASDPTQSFSVATTIRRNAIVPLLMVATKLGYCVKRTVKEHFMQNLLDVACTSEPNA